MLRHFNSKYANQLLKKSKSAKKCLFGAKENLNNLSLILTGQSSLLNSSKSTFNGQISRQFSDIKARIQAERQRRLQELDEVMPLETAESKIFNLEIGFNWVQTCKKSEILELLLTSMLVKRPQQRGFCTTQEFQISLEKCTTETPLWTI